MIEPLKHRVLIQITESAKFTESGLTIPEKAQKKEDTGIVLAIGKDADSTIKVGHKILFGKHDGFNIDPQYCDGQERCIMMADNQVRCIINEEETHPLG